MSQIHSSILLFFFFSFCPLCFCDDTVWNAIEKSNQIGRFRQMLADPQMANVVDQLRRPRAQGQGRFLVFAPNDAAVRAYGNKRPMTDSQFKALMSYHIAIDSSPLMSPVNGHASVASSSLSPISTLPSSYSISSSPSYPSSSSSSSSSFPSPPSSSPILPTSLGPTNHVFLPTYLPWPGKESFNFTNLPRGDQQVLHLLVQDGRILVNSGNPSRNLDTATIVGPILSFSNGEFAVIDKVMNYPMSLTGYRESGQIPALQNFPNLSELDRITGLTLFVPSTQAFLAFEELVKPLLTIKEIQEVWKYHIVVAAQNKNSIGYITFPSSVTMTTAQGNTLSLTANFPALYLVNDIWISTPNVLTKNGVLHIVDRVLLPPSLEQKFGLQLASYNVQGGTFVPNAVVPPTSTYVPYFFLLFFCMFFLFLCCFGSCTFCFYYKCQRGNM